MKTTFEISEDLFAALKSKAAQQRLSMRGLVLRALRREISGPAAIHKPKKIHWPTPTGGLPPGLGMSNRAAMHDGPRHQDGGDAESAGR